MTKIAILHPGIYEDPKNDALTTSFLADVTVIRYTEAMTKQELLAAAPDLSGLTHVAFLYHYPGYSSLPFFPDIPVEDVLQKPKYRYFSDAAIDILQTLRSGAAGQLTVDILSCDLKEAAYAAEVAQIEKDLGVNIRYSVDKTGNPADGGNWIVESEEPAVSVRDIYFTEGVLAWTGVLTGDITAAVKAGTYSAYIAWNGVNTYTVQQNFNWTDPTPTLNNTSFITMQANEIFDGSNNKAINLTGITNWSGFIVISPSVTDLSGAPLIKALDIANGSLASNGGGIVCGSQSYFKVEYCRRIGAVAGGAGGIAGSNCSNCEINNCSNSGNIVGNVNGGGGIISYNATNCKLSYCSNSGTIGSNVGGILGSGAGNCVIDGCANTGSITSLGSNAGGIAGSNTGLYGPCIFTNCNNSGSIGGQDAGGIVGAQAGNFSRCDIINCENTGLITGNRAGGIVGAKAGLNPLTSSDGCFITGCSSTSSMSGDNAGGIAGYRAGIGGRCVITECYVNGTNTGLASGGIVGSEAGYSNGNCTITNCYKLGNIAGISSGGIAGAYAGIGGVLPDTGGSCVITNCYTIGNIVAAGAGGIVGLGAGAESGICSIFSCYSTGAISGERAGGIAGEEAGVGSTENSKCLITNCYSFGAIEGTEAGGIAGGGAGSNITSLCEITNCYSAGEQTGVSVGGIVGATSGIDSGSCIITRCVCNDAPISGPDSENITVNNSSTILSSIDGIIYTAWDPSIWLVGELATVTVDSQPLDYNLPILNGFRLIPWNSDAYNAASDTAQFGVSPPQTSFGGRVNPFLSVGTILVYTTEAIKALVAGVPLTVSARVSWAPLGAPAGSLLRDLRRAAVVPVSATNPLHAYRFQRVQLIDGAGSEGVGGSATDKDAWQTGWICVWSADGMAPVFY